MSEPEAPVDPKATPRDPHDEWNLPDGPRTRFQRLLFAIVDFSRERCFTVLGALFALTLGLAYYARDLEPRPDLLELLPRDSKGFLALEHQFSRMGGGASLLVVVSSPNREANEKVVDALSERLTRFDAETKTCAASCAEDDEACRSQCNADLIAYMELDTKQVRAFYDRNKFLYADLDDLERANHEIDRQIALHSGLVEDLSREHAPQVAPVPPPAPDQASQEAPPPAPDQAPQEAPPPPVSEKKAALGVGDYMGKWDERANAPETYPTGYFANPESTLLGMRIVSNAYLGDPRADRLIALVEQMVAETNITQYDPAMEVGLTGELAAAASEKAALMDEALVATLLAAGLIMLGIAYFYRSFWALPVMAIPVAFGISAAYAYARWRLGYLNAAGAFLAAILLGNGINYPIVLLSRYQDFLARGADPAVAKRVAVYNSLRAEFVGACVASIAYGTLTLSDFRGFSQFGTIGFVGMLLVWLAIVPAVPATVAAIEWLNPKLPKVLRFEPPKLRTDGSRSLLLSFVAKITTRYPWVFIGLAVVFTARAVWHLPEYFADPWEYDFGRMGSKTSDVSGVGAWSDKANLVFGKTNIAGASMIADSPEQVPEIKRAILARDDRDPEGKMLEDIITIENLLPGSVEEQQKKLEVLEEIRDRLTPRVLESLGEEERAQVARAIPPEDLKVVEKAELPEFMSRRFSDSSGAIGTVFYVQPKPVRFADARNHLRLSKTLDNVELPDGSVVLTASRSTIFAEILTSIKKDGPKLTLIAFGAVALVVILAARNFKTAASVLLSLLLGVIWLAGATAYLGERINYINFIAYPITFGIGSEYAFNIADRTRLLGGDVREAVIRSAGAVIMCSFTTTVGYGSLLYSDLQALNSFGRLAVFGEIACLFTAVLFLPSLLTVIDRRKHAKS